MRVAVIGSSGYISGFLLERFAREPGIEPVLKIDRSPDADVYLNLEKAEEFDDQILEGVDFVVFTAAISGPDMCASEFDYCWAVNVTGTSYVIRKALAHGCRVLFFSSDAVFGDVPGMVYDENAETRPVTPYGRMKKAIEDMFQGEPSFKAIRLSYVTSARDRFVSYCLDCIDNRKTAEVFHPFYRNCITVRDVVDTVVWFAKHWEAYVPSVLNVAGKELVSRVRIADEINRCLEGALHYTISRPEEAFYRNRPAITQIESLYLGKYGILSEDSFTKKFQKELRERNHEM